MIPADIERSMVPQEVPSVPDIVETGDDGKGEGEPEEGGHEKGVGMGQSGEEFSPHYDDMLASWADGKYYGMSLTRYKTVDAWKVELKP